MKIWVDADACPAVIRDILFRAARRTSTPTTLVANQWLRTPPSKWITSLQVAQGADQADDEIVRRMEAGDLVITADIPLAARVVELGGRALSPHGDYWTPDNIREALSLRNFMDELRGSGVVTGGPPTLGPADRQAFANHLDGWLSRHGG